MQICNISPDTFPVRRHYGLSLVIPPAPKGGYSSAFVHDMMDKKIIYQGLKEQEIERIPFPVPADVIVRDIFSSEQLEEKGCFVPAGEKPTPEEISVAQARRTEWLIRAAEQGDRLFSQFGQRGVQHIPDYCKRAVTELGESRDWVFRTHAAQAECTWCGASVKRLSDGSLPAICANCKGPVDREKAAEFARLTAEPVHSSKEKQPVSR